MKYKILNIMVLSCVLNTTKAESLYLDIHGYSKHRDWENHVDVQMHPELSNGFIEINPGVGLTYEFDNWQSASVGVYKNSLGNNTVYGAYGSKFKFNNHVAVTLNVGIVSGYYKTFSPMVAPALSIGNEYRVNIGFIPEINKITPEVSYVNFQIKIN